MEYSKRGRARGAIIAIAMAACLTTIMTLEHAQAWPVDSCTTQWEQSEAAAFCGTPTYTEKQGPYCGIRATCEVNASIVTGVNEAGDLVRTAPQNIATASIGPGGWFGGAVPQEVVELTVVCVSNYGSSYELQLTERTCRTEWISADDAVTYGVPTAADWNRRDSEARLGMVDTDSEGVLPVYRSDSNLQACVDGWVLAGASYFCQGSTVGTTGQGGAGAPLPKCEISAYCSATADVYDPGRTRVIAHGVTWEGELRTMLPNDPVVATWSQTEIENVELCLEETGMENDIPSFTMHARTGCEASELSAGEARSRGVAGHRGPR